MEQEGTPEEVPQTKIAKDKYMDSIRILISLNAAIIFILLIIYASSTPHMHVEIHSPHDDSYLENVLSKSIPSFWNRYLDFNFSRLTMSFPKPPFKK